MSRASYSVIETSINGKDYTLKVSGKSIDKIEKTFGGIMPAMEEISKVNSNTLAQIIAAGAYIGQSGMNELKEDIRAEGLTTVAAVCIDLLGRMMNPSGGDVEEGDGEGED